MRAVRQKILDAAEFSIKRAGASSLQVQEICVSAGVSRTSFYREFRNVDDVIGMVAIRNWQESNAVIIAELSSIASLAERWRRYLFLSAKRALKRSDSAAESAFHAISLMYRDSGLFLKEIIDVMRPMIEHSQLEGLIRTDISIPEIADGILRQIWALSSVPFLGPDVDLQLMRQIELFVLPALLFKPSPTSSMTEVLVEIGKLSAAIERVERGMRPKK